MDDNKKIVCNQTYNEIDKSIVKIETMESEQNLNPENLDVNFVEVPSMEENHSGVGTKPKRRIRRGNKSQTTSALLKHGSTDLKLILKKDRFRPIRPKPLQSGSSILRHKYGLPMMNMTLSPNRIIVPNTVPIKEKIRYVASSDVSNKNNCIKPNSSNKTKNSDDIDSNINIVDSNIINNSDNSNTVNIPPVTDKNKIDKTVKTQNSNTVTNNCKNNNKNNTNNSNNSNSSNNNSNNSNNNSNNSNNNSNGNSNYGKDLRTNKAISKSHKNSIELFFESMAQTVLNLPNEVQADIKMQICKIVTKAEILYCGSQAKFKTEN